MKGAIASVELFAWPPSVTKAATKTKTTANTTANTTVTTENAEAVGPRRLTLVVGSPARGSEDSGWTCRVALADLERPVEVTAVDSVGALSAALARAEAWLDDLRAEGIVFTRDRAGSEPYL